MKSLIFLILAMSICIGCEMLKGSCITVGGGKDDMTGSITYCFDKKGTQESGAPTFEKIDEDGGGESTGKLFGFDIDQIKAIYDKIRGKNKDKETGGPKDEASTKATLVKEAPKNEALVLEVIKLLR